MQQLKQILHDKWMLVRQVFYFRGMDGAAASRIYEVGAGLTNQLGGLILQQNNANVNQRTL